MLLFCLGIEKEVFYEVKILLRRIGVIKTGVRPIGRQFRFNATKLSIKKESEINFTFFFCYKFFIYKSMEQLFVVLDH